MYSPGACIRRVGIYFPCGHVLLFVKIKKIPGPSMYSPGACIGRVGIYFRIGIYFPARHVLLFVKSKKKSRPQHVLTE